MGSESPAGRGDPFLDATARLQPRGCRAAPHANRVCARTRSRAERGRPPRRSRGRQPAPRRDGVTGRAGATAPEARATRTRRRAGFTDPCGPPPRKPQLRSGGRPDRARGSAHERGSPSPLCLPALRTQGPGVCECRARPEDSRAPSAGDRSSSSTLALPGRDLG